MKFKSLRQKLIVRNAVILFTAMMFVLGFFLFFIAEQNKKRVEDILEKGNQALIDKGNLLVTDKNIALTVHVEDNSLEAIQGVLEANATINPEMVKAGFVDSDDRKMKAWYDREDPEDKKGRRHKEHFDPIVDWALDLKETSYIEQEEVDGVRNFWFGSPIDARRYEVDDESDTYIAGAIFFVLSDSIMQQEIEAQRKDFEKSLKTTILTAVVIAFLTLIIAFILTQRQAANITQPLGVLTTAADTIACGEYNIEVEISSGDEIEILATSFNQMARDLDDTYAQLHTKNKELEEKSRELEKLNTYLDKQVEDRTRELRDSESKFRTLFEKSADAILIGNEQEFLDCNPAMLRMLMGRVDRKDEFLSMSPYEISPEEQPDGSNSAERLHEIYQKARTEGSQHIEWVNRRLHDDDLVENFHTEIVVTSFNLNDRQVLHMVFRDITERKRTEEALREAQGKLVETAHSAGMAEIATGVLHNIGNILNSVNISTEEISLTLKNSKVKGFLKANEMVRKHMDDLTAFFSEHPKGKLIPGYYLSLGDAIHDEHNLMLEEIKALVNKVSMMRDVISTQQNYAKASLYTEDVVIRDIVEDALKLQIASLNKQGVKINRLYRDDPKGEVPKVKLVHVLTNLIKNGKEAMAKNESANKEQYLNITIKQTDEKTAQILIEDNGCGIREENLDKIFNHGFTTKENGHGFGLHTCANFMTEMDGALSAESVGEGSGAVFIVTFPLVHNKHDMHT